MGFHAWGRPYALACASLLACAVAFPTPQHPPETAHNPGNRPGFTHKSIAVVELPCPAPPDPGAAPRVEYRPIPASA